MNYRIALQIFILVLLGSCKPKRFSSDYFKVAEIVSGNQFKLVNDYTVNLIGVSDTKESYNFLQEKLKDSNVRFVFDSFTPDYKNSKNAKTKEFYSYVVLKDGTCLNSLILSKGYSSVNFQPYLNDSLKRYLAYTGENQKEDIVITNDENANNFVTEKTSILDSIFDGGITGEMKILKDACDFMNPITRNFAVKLAGKNSGEFSMDQIINIYDAIRPPNWHYVEDPRGHEYFSFASNTISNTELTGDCDDFAILMYSMITAIGGEARITFAWKRGMGHAFAEVNIGQIDMEIFSETISRRYSEYDIDKLMCRKDEDGVWLNLDWWAAYPGGKYMDYDAQIIFYPDNGQYVTQGI